MSHKREMLIIKVLGSQQAAEGFRMLTDVIDQVEYENQLYIVDKLVLHSHVLKFPKNQSQLTKILLKLLKNSKLIKNCSIIGEFKGN